MRLRCKKSLSVMGLSWARKPPHQHLGRAADIGVGAEGVAACLRRVWAELALRRGRQASRHRRHQASRSLRRQPALHRLLSARRTSRRQEDGEDGTEGGEAPTGRRLNRFQPAL